MSLIKMVEIYEDTSHGLESRDRHALREVVINSDYVMAVRNNPGSQKSCTMICYQRVWTLVRNLLRLL